MILAVSLCSCSTKRKVIESYEKTVEQSVATESVEEHKEDTLLAVSVKSITEKEVTTKERNVEKHDSVVVTVDEHGNIRKQEIWHNVKSETTVTHERERELLDSLSIYKSRYDSIYRLYEQRDSIDKSSVSKVESKKIVKCKGFSFIYLAVIAIIIIFVAKIYKRWH